jgi:sugar lactone lactonase YvrE
MTTGGAGGVELAVDVRCGLGESPVWDWRTGELVWVDIRGGDFYRWSGPSCPGGPGAWRSTRVGHCVSAVAPRAAGGFVLATRSGFATLDEAGTFEMMAEVESDMAENRMNDAKCDHRGRLFAGTMSEKYEPGAGSLYVLDVGGAVSKVLGGATTPNGLDWSPDGKTMYFIDSRAYGLDAFDFAEGTGRLTARRRLVDVERHLGLGRSSFRWRAAPL